MTPRQEMIEKVRSAVVKANPSILNLVFGCEVFTQNPGGDGVREFKERRTIVSSRPISQVGLGARLNPSTWIRLVGGIPNEILATHVEIIGRPVRLADLLPVIQEASYSKDFTVTVSIRDSTGEYEAQLALSDANGQRAAFYSLRNDDLTQQSDELLAFLCELLSEK